MDTAPSKHGMRTPKPLNGEACRIIIAIQEGRFGENGHGRYVIDGEERPDRKTREALRKRGLIRSRFIPETRRYEWYVTAKGAAVLKRDLPSVADAIRAQAGATQKGNGLAG